MQTAEDFSSAVMQSRRWLFAIVALRYRVGIRRQGVGVAADAHGVAHGRLRGGRAVGLEGRLPAESAVALEDLVGVDRGRARIAALGEGIARRALRGRRVVGLARDEALADLDVALVDRVVVERERAGR